MNASRALLSMRLHHWRNHLRSLRRDSATKTFVVIFGLASVMGLGLWISLRCFEFAERFFFGADLNARLIGLLFFALLILVTFSTAIISFTTLFIARETEFLFQHPIPPRTVLFLKCAEAISFGGWASLCLCLPVLVSYGLVSDAPLRYYGEACVILATFLLFAGLGGATITLFIAPLVRRMSPRTLLSLAVGVLLVLGWFFLRSLDFWALDGKNNLLVLDRFMSTLQAMQSPWSPSRWASDAVLASAAGNHEDAVFHWAVLLANSLIFLPVLGIYGSVRFGREWVARRSVHHTSVERPAARERARRGRVAGRSPVGSLTMKDLLVFCRDPAQLSQSFLFVLLMIAYSQSVVHLPRTVGDDGMRLFLAFANMAAVCMILSSFTSRFLFPLLSLEGRAFWIIGLAPISRWTLLLQKMVFGLAISLTLGSLTMIASNLALETTPDLFATSVYTVVLAAFCLTSLAIGLGAAYPSFGEDNPARIAAGVGGTLNFFTSALVVALLVAIEGAPYLLWPRTEIPGWATLAGHLGALLFTLVVCGTVLRLGGRALVRAEF